MQTTQNWSLQQLPDMDTQQFRQWQTLLEARTGVCVSDQRKTFLPLRPHAGAQSE